MRSTSLPLAGIVSTALAGLVALATASCGIPHVTATSNLLAGDAYDGVFVESVEVRSTEQTAHAGELNRLTAQSARDAIVQEIQRGGRYRVFGSRDARLHLLAVKTTMDVTYGSRGLRYVAGFAGAGKGSVTTGMDVVDASTNQTKMHATAKSSLTGGVYGGGMDETIEENVRALVRQSGLVRGDTAAP